MSIFRKIEKAAAMLGFSPRVGFTTIINLPWYFTDQRKLKEQAAQSRFDFPFATSFPCLSERSDQSGATKDHYFQQDLRVARRVFELNPVRHFDVGSRIDGFVAHVATFRPIEVFDIRPMTSAIHNVTFRQADLMCLDEGFLECTDSLSCLHTIEHFGLGRYGDPVDFDGFDKGLRNLRRMLKPYGRFHFSTPMGPQRIEFNAHRVFSAAFLIDYFSSEYQIDRFSYVNDQGELIEDISLDDAGFANSFGCRYGCAILELVRLD
jgi:SAM-dependent methyltransferase